MKSGKLSYWIKFLLILLILWPILSIYGNPQGWDYAIMLLFPVSVLYFLSIVIKGNLTPNRINPMSSGLFLYFVYGSLAMFLLGEVLPLGLIQRFLLFFMFYSIFNKDFFIKAYKSFALIFIIFFVIQELSYQSTGFRISGIIPGLPLHNVEDTYTYMDRFISGTRSSSFFSEPAHFAQFLLPLLAIELYYDKSKYHTLYVIAIVAVLILLRSGNGIIGILPILLLSLPVFSDYRKPKTWIKFFVIALAVLFVGYYTINIDIGKELIERQSEISSDYSGGNKSGFLRIWRGLYVFEDYSWWEKIFGCPNSLEQLVHVKSSGMLMEDGSDLYFNAFQKILLNSGLIGVIIFIYVYINLWQNNSVCGRAILLTLIFLSFIAAIYMSSTMLTYLLLSENMKTKEQQI